MEKLSTHAVAGAAPPLMGIPKRNGLRGLIDRILPRHTYAPLRSELHMAWVRWKSRGVATHYKDAHDLLVNLGAGDQGRKGWINVDAHPRRGINCVYDCRKSLPFPDQSVRGIFCEHFFEHIDYHEEAPHFLRECHRVLQPGGVFRVIVPDIGRYLHAYSAEGWEELRQLRPLDAQNTDFYTGSRYVTKMELMNVLFRQGFEHKYAYDYVTLESALLRSGFTVVNRQVFGISLMPDLCLDQASRATESLYVDAAR